MSEAGFSTAIFVFNLLAISALYYWVVKPLRILWFRYSLYATYQDLQKEAREVGFPKDSNEYKNRCRFLNALYEQYFRDFNGSLIGVFRIFCERVRSSKESSSNDKTDQEYELSQEHKEFLEKYDMRFISYFVAFFLTGSIPLVLGVIVLFPSMVIYKVFRYIFYPQRGLSLLADFSKNCHDWMRNEGRNLLLTFNLRRL